MLKIAAGIALLSVFVFTGIVHAEKEFSMDKKDNFDGAAIASVKIDVGAADITIEKSRSQSIEVFYKNTVLARDQAEADEINNDYKYKTEVVGDKLIITLDEPRHHRHDKGIVERLIQGDWSDRVNPMIKLSIPDGKAVEVNSASSDIDVHDLALDLKVESSSSDITMENTQGQFACELASGDISISGHKGAVSAKGQSSDISLSDIEGAIDAGTASGDVHIEKVKGQVKASTASGDLRVADIDGDLDIEAVSGDVLASSVSGSVRAEDVSGDITLSELTSKEGSFDVSTVSGDISMQVSRDFSGEMELNSMSGDVNSRLLGKVVINDDSRYSDKSDVRGTVGEREGKGRLYVSSTSGDIVVDGF